jgi:ryanodine receptor 2
MNSYSPKPIETGGIELPSDISSLSERLAENIHDVWALERMTQGWEHGPQRDDVRKQHPCLVPYSDLPENEKIFDRKTAESALKSVIALGYQIRPSAAIIARGETPAISAWLRNVENEGREACAGGRRGWTFDMDDGPEIASLPAGDLPVLRAALEELQARVFPAWLNEDATAMKKQRRHAQIAACAIWPGILAVLFAILQLTCHHFPDWRPLADWLMGMEAIAVLIATAAVLLGLSSNVHHGWLAHRQRAERLRSLKFRALSWPELWCDLGRWQKRLAEEVTAHQAIKTKDAHHWAREKDTVNPEMPTAPGCVVPEADLKAAAVLYRVKRLEFQRHYFEHQAVKAHRSSWIVDKKLGLILFALSVVVVLFHVGHHFLHGHQNSHGLSFVDAASISIAALLPIIGFGFRAWLAAFEAPRSRNLYRAKALALNDYIQRSRTSSLEVEPMLQYIAQGEHFFINEHREWCRLQMEAEWFA